MSTARELIEKHIGIAGGTSTKETDLSEALEEALSNVIDFLSENSDEDACEKLGEAFADTLDEESREAFLKGFNSKSE